MILVYAMVGGTALLGIAALYVFFMYARHVHRDTPFSETAVELRPNTAGVRNKKTAARDKKIAQCIAKMGTKYIGHPDNFVKRKTKTRSRVPVRECS